MDHIFYLVASNLFMDFLHASLDPEVLCMTSPTHKRAVEPADSLEIVRSLLVACLLDGRLVESGLCTNLDGERELDVFEVNLACISVQ